MKGEKMENMIVDHQRKRRTTFFRRNPANPRLSDIYKYIARF